MKWTKMSILRELADVGGTTNLYPFIQMGLDELLEELIRDGFVERVPSKDNFCEIHITDKGRSLLMDEVRATEQKGASVPRL